jgi:hypothetical protein
MSWFVVIRIFTVALLCASASISLSQNLEEISLKKGVDVSGSLNLNTVGYAVHGIEERRDPFNWFFTGSVNINAFGYSAPFSFSYSNAGRNYSQPFNQFSFAPQYKWVKAYAGYNSMTFSNYTLAGHVFLGGGVELTPGKWRVSAMYGRLRKAVEFNIIDSTQYTDASFRRMGYGLKVGYEDDGNTISANIFTAKDDVNSIPFILPNSTLTPQQNVAMSVSGRKKLFHRFFIEGEYALSVLNTDTRANFSEADTITRRPTSNLVKGLVPENATNRYFDAVNASFGYQGNAYSVQVRYERVAPEYQTLGAYYFNNDMRNITLVPSVRLLKNTLNLAGNVGFQQNNLDDARTSTTKRFVGAINANYAPTPIWNFVGSYSNFSSYTNTRPQADPYFQNTLDTLNFYQVSQTTTATVMRMLGGKASPQAILLTASYQEANDRADYDGGDAQSDFTTANVTYSYSHVATGATLAIGGNVYQTNAAGISSVYWGPTLSATQAMMQKTVRASLASTYNEMSGKGLQTSPVWNNRMSLSYSPKRENEANSSHSFSLGLNLLRKFKSTEQQPRYTELTGTFNYAYTF